VSPDGNDAHSCISPLALSICRATGARDSDWILADRLAAAGYRQLQVWVTAPLDVALDRLADRRAERCR
jgi:hypothetical protein